MQPLHDEGKTLQEMADGLKSAGYPVFYVDTSADSQIYLSVCASNDGRWVIAATSEFSAKCAGTGPAPGPSPGPSPSPGGQCVPDTHGPACSQDSDCGDYDGCVRCAGSGYCTCVDLSTGRCA